MRGEQVLPRTARSARIDTKPMLDLPLPTAPLVFFDFETTGLYPYRGDRVCEVATQCRWREDPHHR